MNDAVAAFEDALLAMDRQRARCLLLEASRRLGPLAAIEELVITALDGIGRDWDAGDLALSQVYMSGRICEDIIDLVLPLEAPSPAGLPVVGIATFEDYHMLGKRIVDLTLRSAGYRPIDYGRLETESALRCARDDGLHVLCLSVLMLNSALHLASLRNELHKLGTGVLLVVGGAPFRLDEQLGEEVGADAVGRSASDAIRILRSWGGGVPCLE